MDIENDEDCLFFQKMADKGHYGKRRENQSRQGTYVFTPDGKFLSSINDLSADRVLATLEQGLKKWNSLPESEKQALNKPVSMNPKHRWEDYYPSDGMVLTIYNRDLPSNSNPDSDRLPTWNRDSAWFSAEEADEILPSDLKNGQSFQFSSLFVSRLCRMHFVDSVKGQTEAFGESEIEGSTISGKVTGINGNLLSIEISGSTKGEAKRIQQGVQTQLLGTAVYDRFKKRFTKFEMVALGERWGKTRFNGRRRQLEKSSIGFVFELAKPGETPLIPGIIWEYDGLTWLPQPTN